MRLIEIYEMFKQVLDSLRANKMRSALSALGVLIGISFMILMGWAIRGLDIALEETFNMIGTDMLYVDKWDWAGGKRWEEIRQRKDITLKQAEEFIDRVQTAEMAMPIVRQWQIVIKYKNETYDGMIAMGTYSDYGLTSAGSVEQGRFFSKFEEVYGANVIVLGHKVAEIIFPNGDAVGKTIKLNGNKFLVVGVVEKRGVLFIDFIDNQVFMPLKTFMSILGNEYRSVSIAVKAGNESMLDEVRSETEGLMREIRNLPPYKEDDFSINESKSFESSVRSLRLYVWGIGLGMTALSFIVGIIGIMNIMFVSVAERIKEIGIRKSVGAKKISIWVQFIMESSLLCFVGAIISFIGCSILIFVVASAIPIFAPDIYFVPKFLPVELFIISSVVSILVGVFAGLMPAIRAANLDPVEALRHEN